MDDLQRMLIERACERLTIEYCHLVDHGEAARIADLFADGGAWTAAGATTTGRQEIQAWFQRRQDNVGRMSRHVCCNTLIDVVDADHATGVTYLTLYRHDGEPGRTTSPAAPPEMIGEYRDRFVRAPEGWRFERRELRVSFLATAPT